jgi:hypothetical protein
MSFLRRPLIIASHRTCVYSKVSFYTAHPIILTRPVEWNGNDVAAIRITEALTFVLQLGNCVSRRDGFSVTARCVGPLDLCHVQVLKLARADDLLQYIDSSNIFSTIY